MTTCGGSRRDVRIGTPYLPVAARAEESPVALRAPCISSAHIICQRLNVQLTLELECSINGGTPPFICSQTGLAQLRERIILVRSPCNQFDEFVSGL